MDEMTTITTKSLGYALRSLYPGSFASYQGVVFRVTGPEQGSLRGVSTDLKASMDILKELAADNQGQRLLQKAIEKLESNILDETGRAIPLNGNLNIVVPKKIDLRFDESLDMVYCKNPACGTLDKLAYQKFPPKDQMPFCRFCNESHVTQAPVWIPQPLNPQGSHALIGDAGDQGIIRNMGVGQIFCYYSKPGERCEHPESPDGRCVHDFVQKLGSLKMTDPQRPIDSLRKHNPHCPKGLVVPTRKLDRLYRTGSYWYKMDFPRESMTVPLQVSSVETFDMKNDQEVDEVNQVLNEVKRTVFSSKIVDLENSKFTRMRVLEATYGFRVGNRYSGVSSYYIDGIDNYVVGRLTKTQGFVLTLRPEFIQAVEDLKKLEQFAVATEELVQTALHSIKHALLVLAPRYTGFEPEKFYGSYDVFPDRKGAKVYVYDTDDGGNGGFAALMRDARSFDRMLEEISIRLNCPTRECKEACKLCLFIKNCGNVNRKLNRRLLQNLRVFT